MPKRMEKWDIGSSWGFAVNELFSLHASLSHELFRNLKYLPFTTFCLNHKFVSISTTRVRRRKYCFNGSIHYRLRINPYIQYLRYYTAYSIEIVSLFSNALYFYYLQEMWYRIVWRMKEWSVGWCSRWSATFKPLLVIFDTVDPTNRRKCLKDSFSFLVGYVIIVVGLCVIPGIWCIRRCTPWRWGRR